ncbi:MAG: crossover junction endodeoxyribonuclease RuvC [Bacteroidota bacterium]
MPSSTSAVYRILGIDPGTTVLGYAVIEIHPKSRRVLELGTLKLDKFKDHPRRLQQIHKRISRVIDTHKPSILAIEAPFFGKNPQSMLKLGRAQGVCMATAMTAGLEVFEYAPRKIKQSVAGNGNASKEQVAAMLENEFVLDTSRYLADATDALATAVCHYYQSKSPLAGYGGKGGWEAFLRDNQDRIA